MSGGEFDQSEEHKLENGWAFWEHRKGSSNDYGSRMYKLGEFSTVEGFWRYKNNIPNPSAVFFTSPQTGMKTFEDRDIDGFSMFKAGIRPEWEDKANLAGAEFFCRKSIDPRVLDETWERLLLGLISETIDPDNEVCGARVVDKSKGMRQTYRMEMWFNHRDEDRLIALRERMEACLGNKLLSDYMVHSNAMTHHGGGGGGGKKGGYSGGNRK